MKKFTLPMLVMVAAMLFVGCSKTRTYTYTYELNYTDWRYQWNDDQSICYYAYCSFLCPDITPEVLERGSVVAYLYTGGGYQEILPRITFGLDIDTVTGKETQWTEYLGYDVSPGTFNVLFQSSDYYPEVYLNNASLYPMRFKVNVMLDD
ncbi:MAG: hypothetical protein IJ684_05645 [Bacteroidales bacterium]|nr:hypothetical protein [Bacteroidales bacterium]